MQEILISVGVIFVLIFITLYRGSAGIQQRLQKGIDSGDISYDGVTVVINDSLDDVQKERYRRELALYLKVTRMSVHLRVSFPLFRKNSNVQ